AFLRSFFLIIFKRINNIHLGDALLSPLGLVLKKLTNVQVSVTVNGLDVTYKNKFYQYVVPKCLKNLDKIICISNSTLDECIRRGIPESKCVVITPGVYPEEFVMQVQKQDLEKIIGMDLTNKKV